MEQGNLYYLERSERIFSLTMSFPSVYFLCHQIKKLEVIALKRLSAYYKSMLQKPRKKGGNDKKDINKNSLRPSLFPLKFYCLFHIYEMLYTEKYGLLGIEIIILHILLFMTPRSIIYTLTFYL